MSTVKYFILISLDTPKIFNLSKTEAYSIGGFNLGVIGSNFSNYITYCKFGNIISPKTCERFNESYIECPVDAYPIGDVEFSISYNTFDWIKSPQKFSFLPCEAGETAEDFKSNCTVCPVGTFKPTKGIYIW
jgi:hypothetical protein